jgi:HK97 family phage major capsid protein
MATPDNDELELIRKLRFEWGKDLKAGITQAKEEGFVAPELRSRMEKTDADLIKHTDAVIAVQQKQADQGKLIEEHAAKLKAYGERLSRPPGGGGPGDENSLLDLKTLGQRFIEADSFKNAQFSGKFQIQVGMQKTRLRKAVTPIIEGGATTITPPVGAYPIFPSRRGIIAQQFAPQVMRDLLDVIPLDGTNAVEYVTEAWTSGAGYQVLEGDVKGTTSVVYTEHTAVVRTLAHYVKVSRQMASDVNFIVATINNRLTLLVLIKEDAEILNGDNSAGHLWGIMPQATPATVYYPTTAPAQPATDTAIDQLNMAETYIENQFFFPTAYVLHPTTWARIESFKTTYGQYLMPGVPYAEGTQRLWGLPVVTTPVMAISDYLCGAFPGNAALFDRETVNVEMAFQNEDDFIRNLITIRAEERVALAVFNPKAFAKGPFNTTLPGMAAEDIGPIGKVGNGPRK